MTVGLYPMVADVIHAGHILAIQEAKSQCDYLIIGLHCCPNYKQPIQTIYERYIQLKNIKGVDEVIPYQDKFDCAEMIKSLKFDIYFLGYDHFGKDFENKELLYSMNKDVIYLSRNHKYSSSFLKERIKEDLK